MSARGRGRGKRHQKVVDRFAAYRNKILKQQKSRKLSIEAQHHHIEDNANPFPIDMERDGDDGDDFETDGVSDSLLLSSLPITDTDPSPRNKRGKKEKQDLSITHKLDGELFCEQCGIENPENQLCSGQWQIPRRTSTGWLQRNEDSQVPVNDSSSPSLLSSTSSSSSPPLPSSSASRSVIAQTKQMMRCEAAAAQEESKLQDDTVSTEYKDCKATVNLDTVFIPARSETSADLEMWYLKSDGIYKIPAGKSLFVKTTVFADFTTEYPHTCRIDAITPYNHWLGQPIDQNLAIRAGTLNPNFTGFINVCIFNKGQKELIVKAGAPIAVLKRENYLI